MGQEKGCRKRNEDFTVQKEENSGRAKKQTAEVLHSHHKKCQRLHEYCDPKQDNKTETLPYMKHLADKWKHGPQAKF